MHCTSIVVPQNNSETYGEHNLHKCWQPFWFVLCIMKPFAICTIAANANDILDLYNSIMEIMYGKKIFNQS